MRFARIPVSAMPPTVSVVMAAKNYARFLPAAVESVLAQTVGDWELVIVDDGSTDETPAAVRPYLADQRVRYFRSDRLGQSRAKNLGAGFARGELIAYLDADDAWLPTKLEKQLSLLAANPEVGVCFSRRLLIDEAGTPRPANDPLPPRGRVAGPMFVRNFVCFSTAVVRRSVLDRIGGFDPQWDLAIDFDLWLRAARHTGVRLRGRGTGAVPHRSRQPVAEAVRPRGDRRVDHDAERRPPGDGGRTAGGLGRGGLRFDVPDDGLRDAAAPSRRRRPGGI